MTRRRRGFVARIVDDRVDRSIVADLGVVLGVLVFAGGLWQLARPLAWLFLGAAIAAVSVLTMLPAKRSPKGDA